MDASEKGYNPGPDFEEDSKDALVDISSTDSTELWLIQWPLNQLQPADFNGKELSLKLHHDGQLGCFETSSGKSYDVVSYAAQEPDATVFLPSGSDSKVVGKISRRVCLVRYPEPSEFQKPSLRHPNLSSQGSAGLWRNSSSHVTPSKHGPSHGTEGTFHTTLTSGGSLGQSSKHSKKKKRHAESTPLSEEPMRSAGHSSGASGFESQITDYSLGSSEQSHGGKSKKKKKKMKVEE